MPFIPDLKTPPRVVTVPVACFADTWSEKPSEPLRIGLRLIGEGDVQSAHAEALRWARMWIEEQPSDAAKFEDTLSFRVRALVLARAICHPDDVRMTFFDMAEDTVPMAFTTEGILWVYQEWEMMRLERSPVGKDATDDDLETFLTEIRSGKHPSMRRVVRALLDYMLQ